MATKQLSLTGFFKSISEEERNSQFQKTVGILQVQDSIPISNNKTIVNHPKRPIGRPQKILPQFTLLSSSMPVGSTSSPPPPLPSSPPVLPSFGRIPRKKRGSYMNWFNEEKWPLIEAVVKKH